MIRSTLILLSTAATVIAQAPDTSWTRIYQNGTYEFANCVRETSDGGFIIVGHTRTPSWDTDVYLMKTDEVGAINWIETFGGSEDDGGIAVEQTPDDGFIIVGYTESFGALQTDIYLIKTDSRGDSLWSNRFGGDSTDIGRSVYLTSDGGFLISGQTYLFGPGEMDAILIKIDSLGQETWSSTFGGLAGEIDDGFAALETEDGGYMLVAQKGAFGPDPEDVWLIKLDENGDSLWTRTYGDEFVDRGLSLVRLTSGNYLIAGFAYSFRSESYDVYSVIIDENGELLYSNTYGGFDTDLGIGGYQTFDGGCIISGYTRSFSQGENDAYLIKINQFGEMQWDYSFGGEEIDVANSCVQSSDGGYLITGHTYSFGDNTADIFLIKLEPEVTEVDDYSEAIHPKKAALSQNHPNPFNAATTISYTLPEQGEVVIHIYNLLGQRVATVFEGTREAGGHTITWDAADFPSGVYFARLETGEQSENITLVLLK
ncbi:MAG: T9SS type A sorting domain-containing protein [candidate division Zixibacteria bacterium]